MPRQGHCSSQTEPDSPNMARSLRILMRQPQSRVSFWDVYRNQAVCGSLQRGLPAGTVSCCTCTRPVHAAVPHGHGPLGSVGMQCSPLLRIWLCRGTTRMCFKGSRGTAGLADSPSGDPGRHVPQYHARPGRRHHSESATSLLLWLYCVSGVCHCHIGHSLQATQSATGRSPEPCCAWLHANIVSCCPDSAQVPHGQR